MANEDTQEKDQTERPQQTVTVEDVGPARKRLRIEVPQDRITEKVSSSFDRLKTDAVVPGFRRGRVPMRLLEKRFASSVRDDVRMQLITESYSQAIEDQSLDVVGEPEVKDLAEIKLPDDGALTFEVEVEVSPEVTLPDLTGIEVEKPEAEVTDEDIDNEIERQQKRMGKINTIEAPDAQVEADQVVTAQLRILAGQDADDDAEVIDEQPEVTVLVAGEKGEFKGQVAGILIDDLGKQLIGQKIGQTITISMTGPPSHENEKIKDQPITLKLTINSIKELELCPVDDVVNIWGLETVDELRDKLREILSERAKQQQTAAMHQQVRDYLMKNVDLELPEGLTTIQTARILRRQAMELAYQGMERHEIEQKLAELRLGSESQARSELKKFFIIDKAAKELDVDVTEAELNGRIAFIAMQQGRRPEKLRQDMRRNGEIEALYIMIREQKTLSKILDDAKISSEEGDTPTTPETEPQEPETPDTQTPET